MAYTALYRKFRPLKFEDMVGQEHITKTLRNQIMAERVGHAYLFNGGRGTGKTTTAKILARAVNCLNPKDGEPCNECEICKEILEGSLTDVVEMDAASNNSVDDIRGIRDEVNFLPTKAKYRVYIIDEVHMLSIGAFNALLKTLEEPPAHVKFILATTEPQKLPATILSRCQRFDYKKINDENVIKRLKIICSESNIKITEDALKTIAILSEGAMRDAISILENDETTALQVIDSVIDDGKDLYNFLWEVIKYVKDILVYKSTQKLNLYSEEELIEIKQLAEKTDKPRLLNVIYKLSDLENNIKNSTQKTIMFQTGIIKICMNQTNGDISSLEEKVNLLEQKLSNLGNVAVSASRQSAQNFGATQAQQRAPARQSAPKKSAPQSTVQTEDWKTIVDSLKKNGKIRLFTALVNTTVNKLNDQTWEIVFPNGLTEFNKKILEDSANKNDLQKEIAMLAGHEIFIKLKDGKQSNNSTTQTSSGFDDLGIDINIID